MIMMAKIEAILGTKQLNLMSFNILSVQYKSTRMQNEF